MEGRYVGRVAVADPLHGFLCRVLGDGMGVERPTRFRAFQLKGSNEVPPADPDGLGAASVTIDSTSATPNVCFDLSVSRGLLAPGRTDARFPL